MARKPQDDPKLDMTPMIDVVFELIIFFVVSIKQEDIFSKLNVNRPAPASGSSSSTSDDNNIEIRVGQGNGINGQIVLNGTEVKIDKLRTQLEKAARASKDTSVIVKCTETSPHKALVDVLDACYEFELRNVSVFTF